MNSKPKQPAQKNALSGEPRKREDRKPPKIKAKETGALNPEVDFLDHMRDHYGVKTQTAAEGILISAITALGVSGEAYRDFMAIIAVEMEPRDAVEAMLVSQQVATHVAMMGLAGKLMDATSPQLREGYERSMTRLSRSFLAQMDALKRYRSKAQHTTVRVVRVDVHDGGQAVVGAIQTGGRGKDKT